MAIAEVSTSTLAKMSKDQQVSMDVIIRSCQAFNIRSLGQSKQHDLLLPPLMSGKLEV